MEIFYSRALYAGSRAEEGKPQSHTFVISTDTLARDDAIIDVDGWDTRNYNKNPVVLDSHDYSSFQNIVGTATVRRVDGRLEADVVFNSSAKGKAAEQLVADGSLRATSVGWLPQEWTIEEDQATKRSIVHFKRQELLELSVVAVPSDPNALKIRALLDNAPHSVPSAQEETRVVSLSDLWVPIATAMVTLMDSKIAIEETERKRIYQFLERIYRVLGKEPPTFRTLSELAVLDHEALAGLFWEGEMEIETRKGARNSRADREKMQKVMDSLQSAMGMMQDIMGDMDEETDDERSIGEIDLSALTQFTKKE